METWQRILGVEARHWGIKKMKTKWKAATIKTTTPFHRARREQSDAEVF
jgi:hypothetical protein